MQTNILPFPRGKTFSQGNADAIPGSAIGSVEGAVFYVRDDDLNPGSEQPMVLRAVRYTGTSDYTVGAVGEVVALTESDNLLRTFSAKATSGSKVPRPLDTKYPVGFVIKPGDIVYVIEQGVVSLPSVTGNTYGFGLGIVPSATSGKVTKTAAAGVCMAMALETVATTATSIKALVVPIPGTYLPAS